MDRDRLWISGCENREPLISSQTELERHSSTSVHLVHNRRVLDWIEEAREGEHPYLKGQPKAARALVIIIAQSDAGVDRDRAIEIGIHGIGAEGQRHCSERGLALVICDHGFRKHMRAIVYDEDHRPAS